MRTLKDASGLRQIERDMEYFCAEIGTRLAGSPAEKRAADYTAERFSELGMTSVACLPFACKRWLPGKSELITLAPFEETVPCVALTHSAATPKEGVEGDLVILEPQDYERGLRPADFEGKILDEFGETGTGPGQFKLAHSLHIDNAGSVFVADGAGNYVQKFTRQTCS